jgi:hypothetical protein
MGKYFGTNYKNVLQIDAFGPNTDVQNNLIIHRQNPAAEAAGGNPIILKGKLELKPEHTAYGVYLSYNQELGSINKGLFFQINLPVVHVKNDLHAKVTDETREIFTGTPMGVLDFFSGNYTQTALTEKQAALTHAKIGGVDSHTGLADIELMIGYRMADREEHQLSGSIKIILPTGNRPTGEFLYQAIVGNNRHWGLGGNLDASMNVIKGEYYSLECLLRLDYMYVFKSSEKRTLGFRNGQSRGGDPEREDTPVVQPWAHYMLGGEQGKLGVFPLANVLTRDVDITPGGKLQGHASFAYHKNNTTLDFGYSFYGQEGEKVTVKCWENDKYGPAEPTYNTTLAFDVTNADRVLGGPINKDELIVETPATPAVLKHSVHAAISYTLSEWKNPSFFGCGVSVDWTHDNSTPVGYTIWGKFGTTF